MEEILEAFMHDYKLLSEKEKEKFAEIVNKLLNINYMTSHKAEDTLNYQFIENHIDCFKNYFNIVHIELCLYKQTKTIVLKTEYMNKLNLNKLQSIILLIIRLLYSQKLKEISILNDVIINVGEIRNKYENIGFVGEEKLNVVKLKDCLQIFKKYNLVNYRGQNIYEDDFAITVYPTIQYAVSIDNIEVLVQKINCYKEKSDQNEEINEDQID